MRDAIRPAVVLLGLFTLLCGLVYPGVVTGVSGALFPLEAGGSLVRSSGELIGSELIGQPFSAPGYFHGRPSATAPAPYDAAASSGSNLGPSNPALLQAVGERVGALRAATPGALAAIPADLVTASGSGLDPHISPASAYLQVERVARARGLSPDVVRRLVDARLEPRLLGLIGEPRVNVLALNLALDALAR